MMSGTEWRIETGDWRTHAEQSAAARLLLCRLLGEAVAVEHDDKGAPYLPSHPELAVSISHCRRAVAVAVSTEGRVGIDVECRRKVGESLMQRVCTPEEWAAVQSEDDPVMFFLQLWTRKEAVLKMRGSGIQGFGSMVDALTAKDIVVRDIQCSMPDVVCSLACRDMACHVR